MSNRTRLYILVLVLYVIVTMVILSVNGLVTKGVVPSRKHVAMWRPFHRYMAATRGVSAPFSTVSTSGDSYADKSVPKWRVKSILTQGADVLDKTVKVEGWVKTVRDQKKHAFIEVSDGSSLKGLQTVVDASSVPHYDTMISKVSTGSSIQIIGKVVKSPAAGQAFELLAERVKVIGTCESDYPLQKARYPLDFVRPMAHIRARTNTISAVARVRSRLAQSIHAFFAQNSFVYVQTPLITASDCEGAGEMFRVTTLPLEGPIEKLPQVQSEANDSSDGSKTKTVGTGFIDFKHDYFGKPAYLTVSGQLCGEAYACSMGNIYTFGPTFRAENSVGTRHLAEFHMLEPELAFADLEAAMDNAEQLLKFVASEVKKHCDEDIQFFGKFVNKEVLVRLDSVSNTSKPFPRVTYKQAIKLLQAEIAKDRSKWRYPDMHFGTDLQTEHERWLAEVHYKGPVFVHNYPRSIKPFYMRNSDQDSMSGEETVDSFDLLVPGVCELIGGSQREERVDILLQKLRQAGLRADDYQWYIDLRRYGSVPHAGYGLGFERLVCYLTGMENIRDAIAFPRFSGSINF
jgi:asparaginyl-tRNA synthetase